MFLYRTFLIFGAVWLDFHRKGAKYAKKIIKTFALLAASRFNY